MKTEISQKADILKRIREIKSSYTIREQKAELLWRNKAFQADLKGMRLHFKMKTAKIELREKFLNKKKDETTDDERRRFAFMDLAGGNKWFYIKWDIKLHWNGDRAFLPRAIHAGAGVFWHEKEDPREYLWPLKMKSNRLLNKPGISIEIDPWTTRNQLLQFWPLIAKKQKELFGERFESKANFGRDLCWYDLKRGLGLSERQIAKLWPKFYPKEFDKIFRNSKEERQPVENEPLEDDNRVYCIKVYRELRDAYVKDGFPQLVQAAIKRIQKQIEYLTIR